MKKSIFTLLSCLFLLNNAAAQEQTEQDIIARIEKLEQKEKRQSEAIKRLQNLKISGYIQAQYQWGQEHASLKVGAPNENSQKTFGRIGIRRGRIKIAYEEGIAAGVFQLDITEKGLGIKDAYLSIKDPWIKSITLKAGVFDRPFGNEISYSSSRRESPERSTIFQTLFPDERDLGAMLTLQMPETSPLNFLKLEAGIFAGNGIKLDTDKRKDFIMHLSADKKINIVQLGGGVSYYNGGVYQGTENIYQIEGTGFRLNNEASNKGKFAKREYIGFDVQLGITTILGETRIRSEYLFGKQPGSNTGSKSPNAAALPASDTYNRTFGGGYVIFIQDLGKKVPLSVVFKYDWYDPNTKISGDYIGLNNTNKGDIAQHTFGIGMLWNINKSLRLQAYYEINKNEKTSNLSDYQHDRKDDVLTVRLQYKF